MAKKRKPKQRHSRARRKQVALSKNPPFFPPLVLSKKAQDKIKSKFLAGCRRANTTINKSNQELEDYYEGDLKEYEKWQKKTIFPFRKRIESLRNDGREYFELYNSVTKVAYTYDITLPEAYLLVNSKEYKELLSSRGGKALEEDPEFIFGSMDYDDEDINDDYDCDCEFCRDSRKTDMDDDEDFVKLKVEIQKLLEGVTSREAAMPKLEKWFNKGPGKELPTKGLRKQFFKEFLEFILGFEELDQILANNDTSKIPERFDEVNRLYRSLVKELHPDTFQSAVKENADEKTRQLHLELWHKLQSAYRQKDLTTLNNIKIQFEVFIKKEKSVSVSASELIALKKELLSSNKEKRSEIRRLRKSDFWGFQKLPKKHVNKMTKDTKEELREEEVRMAHSLKALKTDVNLLKKDSKKFTKNLAGILEKVRDVYKQVV